MTPAKRDKAYLTHILESLERLPKHLRRAQHGKLWYEDETVREAVLHTLQTMCESCKRLSDEAKARSSEVDGKNIIGFRNVLVHEYLGDIDYDKVTQVIEKRLPQLQMSISRIYKELYDGK